jgi:hypothetical protein
MLWAAAGIVNVTIAMDSSRGVSLERMRPQWPLHSITERSIVAIMNTHTLALQGQHIRLESLEHHHLDGLVAASEVSASL